MTFVEIEISLSSTETWIQSKQISQYSWSICTAIVNENSSFFTKLHHKNIFITYRSDGTSTNITKQTRETFSSVVQCLMKLCAETLSLVWILPQFNPPSFTHCICTWYNVIDHLAHIKTLTLLNGLFIFVI